ncbi:MAG: radical SAM protein [Candidatus Alcyoniella australis]|nr:radical SAM protein [Candidatus Alcyoniella australis]
MVSQLQPIDIVLIQVPPWGPEGPPLGLAQVSSFLRRRGVTTLVIDLNIDCYCAAGRPELWSMDHKDEWVYDSRLEQTWELMSPQVERALKRIESSGAQLVGLSVSSDSLAFADRLLAHLRRRLPGLTLLVGGTATGTAVQRERFTPENVDLMVVGDGELTALELIQARREGNRPAGIPGLLTVSGGVLGPLKTRPYSEDLDQLGWPTFEEFELDKYATPNLPLIASRGCPRGCTLCNDRVLMGPLRRRSGRSLFEELSAHIERYGCHDYMLNDLAINSNLPQMLKLCGLIVESGQKIRFNGNAWVSDLLDHDALTLLRQAGCHTLSLGIESGSDRVLGLMNKGFKSEQALAQMQRVKDAGIRLWINIVIGFPGETEQDFDQTLELIERGKTLIDAISVLNTCNVLPGSILAQRPDEYGIVPTSDARWFEVDWIGRDGNTPASRRERQLRALKLAEELHLEVRQSNVSFEGESSFAAHSGLDLALILPPPLAAGMPDWDMAALDEYLRARNLSVRLLDLNIETFSRFAQDGQADWPAEIWRDSGRPEGLDNLAKRIKIDLPGALARLKALAPRAVYVHATQPNRLLAAKLVRGLDELECRPLIIVGGPAAISEAERTAFERGVDYFVLGDPEKTVHELVSLADELDGRNIRGALRGKDDGKFWPREPLRPLDLLPAPTFSCFALNLYTSPSLPVRLGRGCSFRCAFCAEQPMEGPFRPRSARPVFDEMLANRRRLRRNEFWIGDLIANADPGLLRELARLIAESGEPLRWRANVTPRPDMDAEYFAALAAGGCISLHFGVESFSNEILTLMNKEYDAQCAARNLRHAHAAGIRTQVSLIVGFPGETEVSFIDTARGLSQNAKYIDAVDRLGPCFVPPESQLERSPAQFEVQLFDRDRYRSWSYRGYNNASWRDKKTVELALFIEGLEIEFNSHAVVGAQHPLRQYEHDIRRRLRSKTSPPAEVVLVTTPPWGFDNPPVGLAYLSNYVRAHGSWAEVFDFNNEMYNAAHEQTKLLWHVENKNYWSNEHTFKVLVHLFNGMIDQCVEKLLLTDPPLVGFSVVDPKERMTIEFIRRFRAMNKTAKIVLGGPATFTPEYRQIFIDNIGDLIDGMIVGEGESALLEVMGRVREGSAFDDVPGVLTWDAAGNERYEPRELIASLDKVPWPRYEEFDFDDYPAQSLIVEWSRGCIGACTFCKGRHLAGAYRARSAEQIFEEMRHHVEVIGIHDYTVCDPLINGDLPNLERLCELIIDSGLRFAWRGEGIPLAGISRRLLDKMARAGCIELQLGLECASEVVLKKMNKLRFFKVAEAQRVIHDTHEAGIKTCLFSIIGFPGETREEFGKTLQFVSDNAEWIDQIKSINSLHVITGTDLHRNPKRFGITLPDHDYHYLWVGEHGNTIDERNRRIRALLKLCREKGIEVRETNLAEGKQYDLADRLADGSINVADAMTQMLTQINALQSFDDGSGQTAPPEALDQPEPEPARETKSDIQPKSLREVEPAAEPAQQREQPKEPTADRGPGIDATDPAQRKGFLRDNRDLQGVLSEPGHVFTGPEILEIDLTCNCNSNCVGCWVHSDMLGPDKISPAKRKLNLPYAAVEKLLVEAATMGTRMVQLTGAGEPFMHPRIMDIIARAKQLGLAVTLITNFTLVNKRRAKQLVELGVDNITVSVWAGSPEVYRTTHPKLPKNTFDKLRSTLREMHLEKLRQGKTRPQVKLYNVISTLNAHDIGNMVDFAVDSLAEFIEFTPIDIVPGRTESLALSDADRELIAEQLRTLTLRDDYLELDPSKGREQRGGDTESHEFARFVKRDTLAKGFKYELDDIARFDALCKRKEWQLEVREDNTERNALLFFYPEQQCRECELIEHCAIDKTGFFVAAEFVSFLGFGSFYRRITSPGGTSGRYDAEVIDKLPCTVGWTYARVLTSGDVIPCCKADDLPLGNLHKNTFREIWTSERFREFRVKARDLSKRDPYFAPIQCLKACDNLGMNRDAKRRLDELSREERDVLKDAGRNEPGLDY